MNFQLPKTSYNSPEKREVKSIVEQYRHAREKGEDGIACTTQPYWYGNRLAGRVMADHGVNLREEYSLMSKKEKDCTISMGDGSLKRIQYHSPICRTKIYYRGDRPVLKVREHLQERYILADVGYKNGKTLYCENCGALMDGTRDYGGCPHCGSAVRIRGARKKIVTIDREMSGGWYQWRFILGVSLFFLICMFVSGIAELIQEGDFSCSSVLGMFFYLLLAAAASAPMSIVMGVLFGNFLFVPILISLGCSNARVNRVGYEMRKRDPHFSHTEFYGLTQAYMKLWFLSAEPSDLGCISEVENCRDESILDVDCLGCKGSRVWTYDDFTYISMKLKVRLICAQGEKLTKKRKACRVTMKRQKNVLTSLEPEALKCGNCGASIDMLGDGHCTYCGSRADISSIDWMLCGVQTED